jgi:hypothetical protein
MSDGWQPVRIAPTEWEERFHDSGKLRKDAARGDGQIVRVRPVETGFHFDFCPTGRVFEVHPEDAMRIYGIECAAAFCEHQILAD